MVQLWEVGFGSSGGGGLFRVGFIWGSGWWFRWGRGISGGQVGEAVGSSVGEGQNGKGWDEELQVGKGANARRERLEESFCNLRKFRFHRNVIGRTLALQNFRITHLINAE